MNLQQIQSLIAGLDFTQSSAPTQAQILNLLNVILSDYTTDQLKNPTSQGLQVLTTMISAINTSLSVQNTAQPAQITP